MDVSSCWTLGRHTNAHRRLHTRQLGLIHICGRGKMDESVKEAVAPDMSVGLHAKFDGDGFDRESDSGTAYSPY
jgi:hypothetical protein